MRKITLIIMYILWTISIVALLATTFTSFQYEDLNLFAVVFVAFAFVNTYFIINDPFAKREEELKYGKDIGENKKTTGPKPF